MRSDGRATDQLRAMKASFRFTAVAARLSVGLAGLAVLSAGCQNGEFSFTRPGPEEDVWAILVTTATGADHETLAGTYADALRRVEGLRSGLVQVTSEGEQSRVYYGRYKRHYDVDKAETTFKPDYRPDLERIRNLMIGGQGGQPFMLAMIEPLPVPSRYPEWNLTGRPGRWSLHVAVFYNEGEMTSRRYAAEEYCAELRKQGEEAYFHHGEVKSSVTIGLFPEESLKLADRRNPVTGVVEKVSEIVDPRLAALQNKHPYNRENGRVIYQIRRNSAGEIVDRIPNPSFVVEVPPARPAGGF